MRPPEPAIVTRPVAFEVSSWIIDTGTGTHWLPRIGGFPAHFDPDGWEEDLARTTPAGREVAEAARRAYEQDGIPFEHLRSVEEEGRDGTVLPEVVRWVPVVATCPTIVTVSIRFRSVGV